MTARRDWNIRKARERGDKKVASTETTHLGVKNCSNYVAIPSYLPSGTPTSFIAKRTFQNEYDGGGDPHSVHSPDGRRRAGRTDERRYPSQYITVTALPLFWMRGVKRRPLGRSEQESSPMTKWKVRPTERKRRYRSKAGRDRRERERRRDKHSWLVGPLVRCWGQRP